MPRGTNDVHVFHLSRDVTREMRRCFASAGHSGIQGRVGESRREQEMGTDGGEKKKAGLASEEEVQLGGNLGGPRHSARGALTDRRECHERNKSFPPGEEGRGRRAVVHTT